GEASGGGQPADQAPLSIGERAADGACGECGQVKADELVALDTEELNSRLKGARRELYELRFKLAVGQLDDNRQVRKVRKDIARILTVVHARRLAMVPWGEPPTEPRGMVATTEAIDGEQAVEPAEHVSDRAA